MKTKELLSDVERKAKGWPYVLLPSRDAKLLVDLIHEMEDAIIFMSGSDDFSYPDGKASEGFQKLVIPTLDQLRA